MTNWIESTRKATPSETTKNPENMNYDFEGVNWIKKSDVLKIAVLTIWHFLIGEKQNELKSTFPEISENQPKKNIQEENEESLEPWTEKNPQSSLDKWIELSMKIVGDNEWKYDSVSLDAKDISFWRYQFYTFWEFPMFLQFATSNKYSSAEVRNLAGEIFSYYKENNETNSPIFSKNDDIMGKIKRLAKITKREQDSFKRWVIENTIERIPKEYIRHLEKDEKFLPYIIDTQNWMWGGWLNNVFKRFWDLLSKNPNKNPLDLFLEARKERAIDLDLKTKGWIIYFEKIHYSRVDNTEKNLRRLA